MPLRSTTGRGARSPATHLDREAGRSHRCGAGILVNDLPAIPFSSKKNAAHRFAPHGRAIALSTRFF